MTNRMLATTTIVLLSFAMVGCSTMARLHKNMAIGAGLGAAAGGLWGAAGESNFDAGEGLLVGALAGATAGALVSDAQERAYRQDQSDAIDTKDATIAQLQEDNRSLQRQLGAANQDLATARRRIADLENQVANLQAELQRRGGAVSTTVARTAPIPLREITLLSDVLFAPGSNVLTDAGRQALDDAAQQVMAAGAGHYVQIEGHTDSDPIRSSGFRTNWDLGAARSLAVLHYLLGKGISPQRLSAATMGQYQPVASNTTAADKASNRRAVIVIYSSWPRAERR
jgi:chemotaxis protein MotB